MAHLLCCCHRMRYGKRSNRSESPKNNASDSEFDVLFRSTNLFDDRLYVREIGEVSQGRYSLITKNPIHLFLPLSLSLRKCRQSQNQGMKEGSRCIRTAFDKCTPRYLIRLSIVVIQNYGKYLSLLRQFSVHAEEFLVL